MTEIRDNKSPKSIYEILGIKDNRGIHSSEKKATQATEESGQRSSQDDVHEQYSDLPSGSLFDNYSHYSDGDPAYWRWFRALSIAGICVTVVALILICVKPSYDVITSSAQYKYTTAESKYEEPAEVESDDEEEVEEIAAEEVVLEEPSVAVPSGTMYFKGKINGKYAIHMLLNIDERDGKYYYDKSGAKNCMTLKIIELERWGDEYGVKLEEYNSDNEYCGYWEGSLADGQFKGDGIYLGTQMPFSLTECSYAETDF